MTSQKKPVRSHSSLTSATCCASPIPPLPTPLVKTMLRKARPQNQRSRRIRRRLVPRSLCLGIQEEAQAYTQLNDDREELGNPPLFVVCDFERFEVHTNYTRMSGMSSERTSVSTKRHEGHQAAEGWQSAVGRLRLRSSRLNL